MTTFCEVQDLTDGALQFEADLTLIMSDMVSIQIQLEGDLTIPCQVLLTLTNRPHFAGRITQIAPEYRRILARYIERSIRFCLTDP